MVVVGLFFVLSILGTAQSEDISVLFIGNSYTYQYDIPATVEKLARAANQTLIRDQHTEGGWTLEMHWNSTETLEKIHSRVWDVVVLQEYSTGLAKEDTKLCQSSYPFAQNLANEIREGSPEVELQFYQTWGRPYGEDSTCDTFSPNCDYFTMQDVISTNYETYACMFKPSRIAPVGESFRHVREELGETAFFELFETLGERDHHSSRQGSYLSACLHYLSLFGGSVQGNTHDPGLDQDVIQSLQKAADTVFSRQNWHFPTNDACDACKCDC